MLVKRAAFAAASFWIVNVGASQFRGRKVFPGRSVSAMLADDDADVRACVVATLGRPGYVVLEAARGEDALRTWMSMKASVFDVAMHERPKINRQQKALLRVRSATSLARLCHPVDWTREMSDLMSEV
jgi:hypothetical protein